MTYRDVCRSIKANEFRGGVYVFIGDEDYTKHDALTKLRKKASESGLPEFNTLMLTRNDYSLEKLTDGVQTPPFMSDFKLIEVHGADIFTKKKKKDESERVKQDKKGDKKAKDPDGLCELLKTVADDTAVVFVYHAGDMTDKDVTASELYKELCKADKDGMRLAVFDKATPAEIHKWIGQRMAALGKTASPEDISSLAKRCGYSMCRLVGEIAKLAAYAETEGRSVITADDITAVVSEDTEIGAFELTNAVSDHRMSDAIKIYSKMKKRGDAPELILGSVRANFAVLCTLKTAMDGGMNYREAAKIFGINEYRASLMYKTLTRCDEAYIKKCLMLFSEADRKYKLLPTDLYTQIEQLLGALG